MKSLSPALILILLLGSLFVSGGEAADGRRGGDGGGGYSRGGGQGGGYSRGGGGGYYGGGSRGGDYYRGGGHRGGYYRGGHDHDDWNVGVVIGGPYWGWGYPWYYPSYYPYSYPYPYYYPYNYPYYYPPAASVPSTPPEYIERARPGSSSNPFDLWFYCPDSKTYYPYVKECPGGWETVPAKPPAKRER